MNSSNFLKNTAFDVNTRHPINCPEQNGIAERMNRTIQERVVSMLQHSRLSDGFWAEVLLTVVHIINMSASKPLGLLIPQQLRSPIFLTIYVEGMLLSSRHAMELAELVRRLRLKFSMKDLGPTRHILGMKINQNHNRRQRFCLKPTTLDVS